VWVQLTHYFTDYTSALYVATFWAKTHIAHLMKDATVNRLEAIARIRKGS
jgi:hypothetical protein